MTHIQRLMEQRETEARSVEAQRVDVARATAEAQRTFDRLTVGR